MNKPTYELEKVIHSLETLENENVLLLGNIHSIKEVCYSLLRDLRQLEGNNLLLGSKVFENQK